MGKRPSPVHLKSGREQVCVPVFTARRYAGVVYAVIFCSSVRPSVYQRPILYQNGQT